MYVRIRDGMTTADEGDLTAFATDFVLQAGVRDKSGNDFKVQAKGTPDMSVDTLSGVAYVLNSSWSSFSSGSRLWSVVMDATTNVAIASNSSGSTRIDLVCLKVNTSVTPDATASNVASIVIVQGTPGSGAPATPSNHLLLAQVSVANGATSITSGNITDSRVVTGLNLARSTISGATAGKPLVIDANGNPASQSTGVNIDSNYGAIITYTPSAAGTATINLATSNWNEITMPAGNITIALSNETVGQKFTIRILQDGTGSRTVTWFSTIKWPNNTVPTLTTTASKADMFVFVVRASGTYDAFTVGLSL